MQILVVKMSALGDVIHALPVIPALRKGFPGARIHWLVEETAEPIVRAHPGVDRVLVSRRRLWGGALRDPRRWPEILGGAEGLLQQLRSQRYDLALDLQGLFKSALWILFSGARRRVGFHGSREGSHLVLTERVPPVDPDLHAVERYLRLVEAAGGTVSAVDFGLAPSHEAGTQLNRMLNGSGWRPASPYAVVVPSARWESKEWGEVPFARLGERLVTDLGLQLAFIGVERDRPSVERMVRRMRQPALNLAGKTDLPVLMALLDEAQVVISTDSGPMHLAAALGTSVVGLFGPTAPWRTGPYGERHRVVRSRLQCSPCYRRTCRDRTCMVSIDPEEVLGAVADVMNQGSGLRLQNAAELECRR